MRLILLYFYPNRVSGVIQSFGSGYGIKYGNTNIYEVWLDENNNVFSKNMKEVLSLFFFCTL